MKSKMHKTAMGSAGLLPELPRESRNLAIDRFRGSLVILMVMGDFLSGVNFVPAFLKHAPDIGLTIADTVAPAFIFVIGLNFGPSFARWLRLGQMVAYRQFFMRYLSLIGIGAVISAGATAVGQPNDWGVLQAIGVAGLITLAFIRLPTWTRFLIGTLLLWVYQYLLDASMVETVLHSVHGGLFGSLSWAALLVLSTALADIWRKGLSSFAVCVSALVVVAGISVVIVPVSKHRVSLSYILITLAISALVFLMLESDASQRLRRAGLLCWWGENSLALYFLHLLILAIFTTPPIPGWYVQAPLWLAAIQLTAILTAMSLAARWMQKRTQPMVGS